MLRTSAPLIGALGVTNSTEQMNRLLINIFFLGLSGLTLGVGLVPLVSGHDVQISDDWQVYLSSECADRLVAWLCVTMAIPLAAFPFLEKAGIAQYGKYWQMLPIARAKLDAITETLCLPAIVAFIMLVRRDGCSTGFDCRKAELLGAIFVTHYLYCLYRLLRNSAKPSDA